ncbi:8090_t:CDS:1 [Cetraspora pellucida]|uniref:8090_t:CDS:1 n=1 Tax=Cetraspora pellucida TaxID=1433469 RepID=A0ACA9JWC4_9GLOM|nr:8090_t:CDS:1 [Cetraspora pellucida]
MNFSVVLSISINNRNRKTNFSVKKFAKSNKFSKNPYSLSPPRPQTAFVLFRRDFSAKLKLKKMKMSNEDVSRLASEEWSKQPKEVLENLAQDRHKEIYPDYRYSPKKSCGK